MLIFIIQKVLADVWIFKVLLYINYERPTNTFMKTMKNYFSCVNQSILWHSQ